MTSRDEYYASLARAVAGLDRDSYAARGAIFEREHKALMRHLFAADPAMSDEDISHELQTFREAIRLVEFGDEGQPISLVPQEEAPAEMTYIQQSPDQQDDVQWARQEPMVDLPPPLPQAAPQPILPSEPLPPLSAQPRALFGSKKPHWSKRDPYPDEDTTPAPAFLGEHVPDDDPVDPKKLRPKRRSLLGRLVRRMTFAVLLLAMAAIGYDLLTGELKLPFMSRVKSAVTQLVGRQATPERAILYIEDPSNPNGKPYDGKAYWKLRDEPAAASRPASTVVEVEVDIPGRKFGVTMSLSHDAADSQTLSHLFELKFRKPQDPATGEITQMMGVLMKDSETASGSSLSGTTAKVTSGVFLFGLAGDRDSRDKNLQLLRERAWFDVPFRTSDGALNILTIEKGAAGKKVVDEALAKWAK